MKTALAVLAVLLPLTAAAQLKTDALTEGQDLASVARANAESAKKRASALQSTLTAMNDGPEASGRVVAYLEDNKIAVTFATQPEAVKTVVNGGAVSIVLSDALPAHPRVYAPLIASEVAKKLYFDMPATGERSYMIMATAARAFAELGGDFKGLPVVDGDKVDAVKDLISLWTVGAETAVDELSRRESLPTIPDLQAKAADPKTAAALNSADSRFVAFLNDERETRRTALTR